MPIELIAGFTVAFLAGMVQGCTGFGMALVAAPCMMLVLAPAIVVPTVILLSTVNTFFVAIEARRHIRPRLIAPLALGGVAAFPLGAHALSALDGNMLKAGVGIFVILFSTALLAGWRKPLPGRAPVLLSVGAASGFLGGCTSMGGPPIILFLSNQGLPKDSFRGNIVTYFFTVNCFGIGVFLFKGMIPWSTVEYAAVFLPAMLVGTFCGVRLSRRLPEERFRKMVMLGVAIMGFILVTTGISDLI